MTALDNKKKQGVNINRITKTSLFYVYQTAISLLCVAYLFHQNQKIIALYDFSYFTDLATRINLNQIPYQDFPVASNPGSFYQLSVLLKAFPHSYNAIFIYLSMQSVLLISLIFWVGKKRFNEKNINYFYSLAVFLIPLNIYGIFHQPFYDADAIFWILISSTFLIKIYYNNLEMKKNKQWILYATGASIFLPFFFKQNIGLPWIIFWTIVFLKIYLIDKIRIKDHFKILIGFFTSLLFFLTWLVSQGIFQEWLYWTIQRPLKIRNSSIYILVDGLRQFEKLILLTLGIYFLAWIVEREKFKTRTSHSILLIIPTVVFAANLVLTSNRMSLAAISQLGTKFYPLMIFSLISYLLLYSVSTKKLSFHQVLTLGLLVTIIVAMLPQGFYGSTQSSWPILILGFSLAITEEKKFLGGFNSKIVISCVITSLIFASVMSLYLVRYDWLPLQNRESIGSKNFGLMRTYGNYLPESESMAQLFLKYKTLGKTAIFPGEEPVAFLTGQVPDINVSSSDPTTNPWYSNLNGWLKVNSIEFLIYRENGQNLSTSPTNFGLISTLRNQFEVLEKKGEYVVYKKIVNR